MVECRGRAGLAMQAFGVAGGADKLQRHRPVEPEIAGEIHLAHAAGAKQRFDLVRPDSRA
jgi:hypothetical protein